jgi:nitroreductase
MSLTTKRTSVRRYTNQDVSAEHINRLLTAAMQAPSANNQQPWEFIVVQDKKTLQHLSQASRGAWMLADAPLAIIVVMKDDGRSPMMAPQDCAAATQNILLEAVELGLGAVWIGVYPIAERTAYVNDALHITRGTAFCQIAIGHPAEDKEITLRYDSARVHHERMD